jgi:hypothetical protein
MHNRASLIAAIIIGTFVLSCAQKMMSDNSGTDGSIPDAMAETPTCCEVKPATITKLWEGTLSASTRTSPDIATSAYREVIIYMVSASLGTGCSLGWSWRPDASTPYGNIADDYGSARGRVPVSGSHLRVELGGTTCTGSIHYVVAGVL